MDFRESVIGELNSVCEYTTTSSDRIAPGAKLQADKASLIALMEKNGFTPEEISLVVGISPEELAKSAKTVVDKALEDGVEKTDKPSFYHVAGQPGCGKSGALTAIQNSLDQKPFISEMDVYRTMHPNINAIKEMIARRFPNDSEMQGKLFVQFTAYFADLLELTVMSYMLSQGYSVVKETTGKNDKAICGMIEALKSQNPNMSASFACMAVSQEVSIDGTISRGTTMNQLTDAFTEDLRKSGIESRPIGRGTVPREFSEKVCSEIPGSVERIANSGLIDGEVLIVRRAKSDTDTDTIVARIDGEHCKENSGFIRETLADRITGKTAQAEADAHFAREREANQAALEGLARGDVELIVQQYMRPTMTWLKETDGAIEYYSQESGLTDVAEIARWLIATKIVPDVKAKIAEEEAAKGQDELGEMFEDTTTVSYTVTAGTGVTGSSEGDAAAMTDEDELARMMRDQPVAVAAVASEAKHS